MSNQSTKPVAQMRRGAIKAAIWKNTVDNGNASRNVYVATFQRSYRDEKNEWRSSNSFGRDDLLVLAQVAQRAFEKIHELQEYSQCKEVQRKETDVPSKTIQA